MKKKILLIAIALVAAFNITAMPDSLQNKRGTNKIESKEIAKVKKAIKQVENVAIAINDGDSLKIKELEDSINMILNSKVFTEASNEDSRDVKIEMNMESENDYLGFVGILTPFITAILIVIVCLIYSYKKRKARYALIEKAIENNYTIPDYLINEQKSQTNILPNLSHGKSASQESNTDDYEPLPYNPNRWNGYKSGCIIAGVGLGFTFIYLPIGLILMFIGAAKIMINMLNVRDYENYYRHRNMNRSANKPKQESNSTAIPPSIPTEAKKESNNE